MAGRQVMGETNSNMTMEQQQLQILDTYYPARHTQNYVYPRRFLSWNAHTEEGRNAESHVYEILCQIDEPMFTTHSKKFCVFKAGEMDFLIFSKDRGIIILEVKSGKRIRDYNMAEKQLEKAEAAVKMKLKRIHRGVSVRYAVVMPNVSRQVDHPPHEEGCYGEDLASIEAFKNWLDEKMPVLEDGRKLNDRTYDKCLSSFISVILTGYDLNTIYSHLTSLTPEQAEILEGLNEQAYITGPAGSGKTACLVLKASSEELRGQRKLVVVFNKPLRDHLGKNSLLGVENIYVMTFCQLLHSIIGSRKRQAVFNNEDNQVNLVDTAIQILTDPNNPFRRFDSIFVDEAQDLFGNWEVLFDVLHVKGEGHYKWIFYDNNQRVRYSAPPTRNNQEYHLTKIIRNTKNIFEASKPFYSSNKNVKIAHEIEGPVVVDMDFADPDIENMSSIVIQFIYEKITHLSSLLGVVRPGDICVLMENEDRAYNIGLKILEQSNGAIVPLRLAQMVDHMDGKRLWPRELIGDRGAIGVTVDSVSRFKGLESKAVILVIGAHNTHQVIEKTYVGTTRAFCHLTVLYSRNVGNFLRSELAKRLNR